MVVAGVKVGEEELLFVTAIASLCVQLVTALFNHATLFHATRGQEMNDGVASATTLGGNETKVLVEILCVAIHLLEVVAAVFFEALAGVVVVQLSQVVSPFEPVRSKTERIV